MFRKPKKHLNNGTFIDACKRKIRAKMGFKPVHRFNVQNKRDAASLLSNLATRQASKVGKSKVLIIGNHDNYSKCVKNSVERRGFDVQHITIKQLKRQDPIQMSTIGCIVGCFLDSKNLTELALYLVNNPPLNSIPFEYILIPQSEYSTFKNNDWQSDTSFISPLLIDDVDYFKIYEESLLKFERKCQIRDYMDLCQLLKLVTKRNIEGDIAEFGSFKGHSGYLIAQILKHFDTSKKLYMFDIFEQFPEEIMGVDTFWNETHHVDFFEVKSKLGLFDNICLVKGDFTETFPNQDIRKLCFVYADCDSYRGTKFIIENVFDTILVANGIIVFEDYGHGPLLGSRVAFHEFFDKRNDCFKFFSQFSGFEIVVKL